MQHILNLPLMALLLAMAAGGCNRHPANTPPATPPATQAAAQPEASPPQTVILLAAASTQDAVKDIAANFTRETGITVKISTNGSNFLAQQIIKGEPADVFLSANQQWADTLQQKGLVAGMKPLLTNDLVLIVPKDNPADIASPQDLSSPKLTHLALAGDLVPCGIYGKEALTALGLYDPLLQAKKIVRGESVRVTLTYVESGNAEAGIAYSTDALISHKVTTVYTFDPKTYEKIVYPVVLLKSPADSAAAKQFYDYLAGDEARAIFAKYQFRFVQ